METLNTTIENLIDNSQYNEAVVKEYDKMCSLFSKEELETLSLI